MQKWFLLAAVSTLILSNAQAVNIEAGPIWNNADAQRKCPGVCAGKSMTWDGNWVTTDPGKMSVCRCVPKATQAAAPTTQPVPAQPVPQAGTIVPSVDAMAQLTEQLRAKFGVAPFVIPEFNSIKELIDKGADVNVPLRRAYGKFATTILHLYLIDNADNREAIKFLIAKGAGVNAEDSGHVTPLLALIKQRKGDVEIAKLLIEKGADVNEGNLATNFTPLMGAVYYGNLALAKLLIENGASIELKDTRGFTALHYAEQMKNKEMIDLLTKKAP